VLHKSHAVVLGISVALLSIVHLHDSEIRY